MFSRVNLSIIAFLVVIIGVLVAEYVTEMHPGKIVSKTENAKTHPSSVLKPAITTQIESPTKMEFVASDASVAADEVSEDEANGNLTKTLKGKDFTLKTWGHEGAPVTQTVTVTMNDGSTVDNWVGHDGQKGDLFNLTWNGDIDLKNLIPGMPREQIISHTSDWFPRGEGTLETYSICLVGEGKIEEVLRVITGRDFDGIGDRPAVSFSATVEEVLKNGELSILYRYQDKKSKNRTIIFKWNGKIFEDTSSGKYEKLESQYWP